MLKVYKKYEMPIVVIFAAVSVIISCLPLWHAGIGGYEPDLIFHLLRIDGVRDALLAGSFPVRLYDNFFGGYDYGSPLFYPDIFLVIPACFRILGLSVEISWKLFAVLVCTAVFFSTYFSFRLIIPERHYAMVATLLLTLSQFYLADLQVRVGLSEYIAYIFLPIWMAGIYDFFKGDGQRIYLIGVGLTGMLLTHTIMTFIAGIMSVIIFIVGLFVKREAFFDIKRWRSLIISGIISIGVSVYYLFPMAEQMMTAQYRYTIPFQKVGTYYQRFSYFFNLTGSFNYVAKVGIGIPFLMLIVLRLLIKRPKEKACDLFFFGGLLVFLLTTNIFPWALFNETILNSIQFTYRFYPYGLCFLSLGVTMLIRELCGQRGIDEKGLIIFTVAATLFFGFYQNYHVLTATEFNEGIDEAYLSAHDNSVGSGEWLPVPFDESVENKESKYCVVYDGGNIDFSDTAYLTGSFAVPDGADATYTVPRIFYKGYAADIDGQPIACGKSEQGLLNVKNDSGKSGTITIRYEGTPIQKVSVIISLISVIAAVGGSIYKGRRRAHGKA